MTSSATSGRLQIASMPPATPLTSASGNIFFLDFSRIMLSKQLKNLPSRNTLYITAENDTKSYFRSAVNRMITPMFIHFLPPWLYLCGLTPPAPQVIASRPTYLSVTTVALICVVAFRIAPAIGGLSCYDSQSIYYTRHVHLLFS